MAELKTYFYSVLAKVILIRTKDSRVILTILPKFKDCVSQDSHGGLCGRMVRVLRLSVGRPSNSTPDAKLSGWAWAIHSFSAYPFCASSAIMWLPTCGNPVSQ